MMVIRMIAIPEGVTVQVSGKKITAKGPKGTVEKEYNVKGLLLSVNGKEISVERAEGAKLGANVLNAVRKGVLNMCIGAKEGYTKNMQLIYAHFPISLEIKGSTLRIKNFLGEKQNREARIIGATKIDVKGQNIAITGPDKEAVGQTVANIKTATKIKNRDPRVFQDGLYIVE